MRMIPLLTPQAILDNPRFKDARIAHLDALHDLLRVDPLAPRLMADAGLILMRGYLVAFHMAFDPSDRATWATPGNVRSALVAHGLASPRRVDDLLARFHQAGYLETASAPDDRRVRRLIPTIGLLAHDRAHLATYHRFLLTLLPGRGYEWCLDPTDAIHRALRRSAFHNPVRATSALDHTALRQLLDRQAGYLALLLIARAQLRDEAGPNWTALSETLGVARSHLRSLFSDAQAAGYVALRPRSRRPVEILPALWDAYDRFLAGVHADQDALAQSVFALPV